MRRFILATALTLAATAALAHDRNISINNDLDTFDCSRNRVTFDGEAAHVERQEIPAAGLRSLRVESGQGAVSVRGGNTYSIVACKAAATPAGLHDINVRLDGNTLRADGPSDDWHVSYLVTVPRGADLGIDSSNGPVALRDVDGTINVSAKNGPLSLKNTSGRVTARTTNGPVSITGGSGDVKLSATNGPLSVRLSGAAWDGNLEASTQNGPLSVRIPRGYRSGVRVEALGHGPVTCRAEGCDQYRSSRSRREDRWNDEPRQFDLGSGTQNVRVSTVNGPVTIKEADED